MSPLCINMLLHYYARTTDYAAWASDSEPAHARSAAVSEALESFVKTGLLTSRYGDIAWACRHSHHDLPEDLSEGPAFEITEKGRAMVEHLCAVQIPICKWIQPSALASDQCGGGA